MSADVVIDGIRVASALRTWRDLLNRKGKSLRRRITTPGQEEAQVHQIAWLPEHGFWAYISTRSNGRFHWCAYGVTDAEPTNPVNVTLEINPIVVEEKRARGRILVDGNGRLLLAHKGGRGGGRGRQVSVDEFYDRIRGIDVVNAAWEDGTEERLFVLGDVGSASTIRRVAHYLQQAEKLAREASERAKLGELIDYVEGRRKVPPGSTVTQQLILQRLGQGKFRKDVLKRWGHKCAISGISNTDLIHASHIKAWNMCNREDDRLNPANGLPLVPNFHVLFDCGLISFKDDGTMIISPKLKKADRRKLSLPANLTRKLRDDEREFMEFHRTKVFEQ
jgi:HNH endonuclease